MLSPSARFVRTVVACFALLAFWAVPNSAHSAVFQFTLGNNAPGFSDGDTPGILDLLSAQSGQPVPFDAGIGHELFGPDFSASWQFSYAAIADTILSASISIGIADHDFQASGDQVGSFTLEGDDLTSDLNTLFEASGGGSNEYNVYSVSLASTLFANLADGTTDVSLALLGPGLQTSALDGSVSETPNNAAHLIFSTLTIETQDAPVVPLPAALPLFGTGLALMGFIGWRRKRAAAA